MHPAMLDTLVLQFIIPFLHLLKFVMDVFIFLTKLADFRPRELRKLMMDVDRFYPAACATTLIKVLSILS